MLTRRATALRRQAQGDESGFSLIEVVVAMVVLLVFAGALSVTLLDGLNVSKASRQRVAASNLAARELEIVRNKFSSSDAAALAIAATSSVTNPNPLVGAGTSNVDGTAYTVRRDVQWLPTGTGVSACDGGALVNSPSLQVFVTVTWPNMRTAQPVTRRDGDDTAEGHDRHAGQRVHRRQDPERRRHTCRVRDSHRSGTERHVTCTPATAVGVSCSRSERPAPTPSPSTCSAGWTRPARSSPSRPPSGQ